MEGCSLNPCNPSEIPQCLEDLDAEEPRICAANTEKALSSIEGSFSLETVAGHEDGVFPEDVWMVEDEVAHADGMAEFIDLHANPERFTGYKGFGARAIWSAIYNENCFMDEEDEEEEEEGGSLSQGREQCMEKRVFFRLISGLHASITAHLVGEYYFEETGEWGPNYEMWKARFGSHPEHLENLYFAYMLSLRALDKAAPLLEAYHYRTDDAEEEADTLDTVIGLTSGLASTLERTCPVTFDESAMFQGPDAVALRSEFQAAFYNISRIMDCVECSKCRLWGKIQIRGLAVALRILFGDSREVTALTRNQVLTFFWTLHRLSESLSTVQLMRSYELHEALVSYAFRAGLAGIGIGVFFFLLYRLLRSSPPSKPKQS